MCILAILSTGIGWAFFDWVNFIFDLVLIVFYIAFLFLAATLRCRPPVTAYLGLVFVIGAACWAKSHLQPLF